MGTARRFIYQSSAYIRRASSSREQTTGSSSRKCLMIEAASERCLLSTRTAARGGEEVGLARLRTRKGDHNPRDSA